jgi:hypothetical protein
MAIVACVGVGLTDLTDNPAKHCNDQNRTHLITSEASSIQADPTKMSFPTEAGPAELSLAQAALAQATIAFRGSQSRS